MWNSTLVIIAGLLFIILLLSLLLRFKGKRSIPILGHDLVLIIYLIYLLVNFNLSGKQGYSENELVLTAGILLYITIKYAILQYGIKNIEIYVLIFLSLIVLVLFVQYIRYFSIERLDFKGPMENSGQLGALLSLIFPIFVQRLRSKYFVFLACITIFLIISTGSRISLIASGISLLYIYRRKLLLLKKSLLLVVAFLIPFIILLLFLNYNKGLDSFRGRLLIWEIALTMTGKPFFGYGQGSVNRDFGYYSMEFFKTHQDPKLLITGKVNYIFNDYLQLFIEQGVIGLLYLILIVFILIKTPEKTTVRFKYSLITLSILALGSYPLEMSAVTLLLSLIIAMIVHNASPRWKIERIGTLIVTGAVGVLSIIYLTFVIKFTIAKNNSQYAQDLMLNRKYEMAQQRFGKAFPFLKCDYQFLTAYAKNLFFLKNYLRSNQLLASAKQFSFEPYLFITEGDNFVELGKPDSALSSYKIAAGIYPALMFPKYKLAKFYESSQNLEQAKIWARKILESQPKILSPAIESIYGEMLEIVAK